MIHGGLLLNAKTTTNTKVGHCCLRSELFTVNNDIWNDSCYQSLREQNNKGEWNSECSTICKSLENSGYPSFRTGMNDGLDIYGKTNLSGPARIDIQFDTSCNLACRTCGPSNSTFWVKHLKENNLITESPSMVQNKNVIIKSLSTLNLENLRQVVFCGGETLMGNSYWSVARWLVENVPDAQENLLIAFQTNGTQPIDKKYYDIIEKTKLVKLHISIDGYNERFEYLRWPAKWNQTIDNIKKLRDTLPSNCMFVIEETISIFNLFYLNETESWIKENFTTNREGDAVNHTRHLATGIFSLHNCSERYVQSLKDPRLKGLIPKSHCERIDKITEMVNKIKKFDKIRNQSFAKTFPEVYKFYSDYF